MFIPKGVWSSFEAMNNCSSRRPLFFFFLILILGMGLSCCSLEWDGTATPYGHFCYCTFLQFYFLPTPCLWKGGSFCLQLRSLITEKCAPLGSSLCSYLIEAISRCVHRKDRVMVSWNYEWKQTRRSARRE